MNATSGLDGEIGDLPPSISSLIDGAVGAFDVDRSSSRRYLMRAAALLRAKNVPHPEGATARGVAPRGGLATWQVNRVLDYIEDHLAQKIRSRELAHLVDLSVGQLFRAFKLSVGVPPFHYIKIRRIELACAIMKTSQEPLAQIAIAAGLCDQPHFCRVFRQVIGMSPGGWRRANAKEPAFSEPRSDGHRMRMSAG